MNEGGIVWKILSGEGSGMGARVGVEGEEMRQEGRGVGGSK